VSAASALSGQAAFYFTPGGNGRTCLTSGWNATPPNCVVSIDRVATIKLPGCVPQGGSGTLQIELDVQPFLAGGRIKSQHIAVYAGETCLGDDTICVLGPSTLGYGIDLGRLSSPDLTLTLRFDTAVAPADVGLHGRRPTGFFLFAARVYATEAAAVALVRHWPSRAPALPDGADAAAMTHGLRDLIASELHVPPTALATRFESLGQNCEFAIVQAKLGASPIGLLRWSSTQPAALLNGLACGFADADDPAQVSVALSEETPPEYYVMHARYYMRMHTKRFGGQASHDDVLAEMLAALHFMKRKFAETLVEADRIFVYRHASNLSLTQIRPILARLRAHGPNTLLWVRVDPSRPAGTVDDLGDGLLDGAIDFLAAPEAIDKVNLAAWVSLLINAQHAVAARHAAGSAAA